MTTPSYYAIIPADVRYDNKLKDKAKLLYGEIVALSDKKGYCYASNKYFADLYKVSITTISLLIKNLIDSGYLNSEIIYKEGTKEILNRYLKILKDPIKENLKENNTSINNIKEIDNNKLLSIKKDLNFELFDKFWSAYPKKKSKGSAEKWFIKNKPSEELVNTMVDKINEFKKSDQWKKDNGQYIPYPTSWLNAKGWEDELQVHLRPKIEKRFFN